MYDSGKQADAVAKYKANYDYATDKAKLVKRIAEYEAGKATRRKHASGSRRAEKEGLTVAYAGEAAKEQAKIEAEKKAEEEARAKEHEAWLAKRKADEEARATEREKTAEEKRKKEEEKRKKEEAARANGE